MIGFVCILGYGMNIQKEKKKILVLQHNLVVQEITTCEYNPLDYLASHIHDPESSDISQVAIDLARIWAYISVYQINEAESAHKILETKLAPKDWKYMNVWLLALKVLIASQRNQVPNMKQALDSALKLCSIIGNDELQSFVYSLLASYYTKIQEPSKAESLAQQTFDKVDRFVTPFYKVDVLLRLGSINHMLRKYDVALNYLATAFDLSIQHNIRCKCLLIGLESIAICANLGQFNTAEHFYKHASVLADELRIQPATIGLHFNLAILKRQQGKLQDAVALYEKSLQLMLESPVKMPMTLFNIYNNLANALNNIGQSQRALEYQLCAEEVLLELNNPELNIQHGLNIALTMVALKKHEEVLPRMETAIKYYKKQKNYALLTRAIRSKAYYYQTIRDYRHCSETLSQLDDVFMKYVKVLEQENTKNSKKLLEKTLRESKVIHDSNLRIQKRQQAQTSKTCVGNTEGFLRALRQAHEVAQNPYTNVFIQGESGTGKELIANLIHETSPNSESPFVRVNCAAISASLYESEFFGYVKGSFTGSTKDKPGLFQQARRGTLFLDEVSELPPEFQGKLLDAIDSKTIIPIGKGIGEIVECRIIASSKYDIMSLIQQDKFRLDLYHRLNSVEIFLPPLKDRIDDISLLVDFFVKHYANETSNHIPNLRKSFYERIKTYSFPGNVRELKNIIERIFITKYTESWDASILDGIISTPRPRINSQNITADDLPNVEKEMIVAALTTTGGVQKQAAKLLNMTEATLCRRIKRYGIKQA